MLDLKLSLVYFFVFYLDFIRGVEVVILVSLGVVKV